MSLYEDMFAQKRQYESIVTATVGVVTNVEDPDKLGRVKVKLLNRSLPDYETDFIRVITPAGGDQFGMFFQPAVDDEVIVLFTDNSLANAYVIGGVWNAKKNQLPEEIKSTYGASNPPKLNDIKLICTKAKHKLAFYEDGDNKGINLSTASKHGLVIVDGKDVKITLGDGDGKNVLSIKPKDGSVEINADKKIVIKAGKGTVTLDSSGITLEGGDIKIKGQNVSIEGTSTKIKGTSEAALESSGQTTVKGSITKIN